MRTRTHALAALLLATAALGGDRDERYSEAAEAVADAKRIEIRGEVSGLGEHAWAGEYYQGEGLAVNCSLSLAPQAGYVFEWHGCLGLYDRNYGAVRVEDGRVHLAFTFDNCREGLRGIAPILVPVAWGERRYLVPADDIVGFCNDVNAGTEPRQDMHGGYLLRRGDEHKPAVGQPAIPEDHRAYLLPRPIEARILEAGSPVDRMGKIAYREARVTLDTGRQRGLLPGMTLFVVEPDAFVQQVHIDSVRDDSASGFVRLWIDSHRPPQVGWRLSTRAPWCDDR